MNRPNGDDESLSRELASLLCESIPTAVARASSTFDLVAAPFPERIVLFGAGGLGRKVLAGLRRLGIEPLAFADNRSDVWGSRLEGVEVQAPDTAASMFGSSATFVVTIWHAGGPHRFSQVREQLTRLGCTRVVPFLPLFWKYPDEFLPYYCHDLPHKLLGAANEVVRAFEMFDDSRSRAEFLAQVRWRLLGDFDGLPPPVSDLQYFPSGLYTPVAHEVFVDCGAFDGDTIRTFLELRGDAFDCIVAFEPDPRNLRALSQFRESLSHDLATKIQLSDVAVSDFHGLSRFSAIGVAASTFSSTEDTEGITVSCERLDDLLKDLVPTFIKMDIEGAELSFHQRFQQYHPSSLTCLGNLCLSCAGSLVARASSHFLLE